MKIDEMVYVNEVCIVYEVDMWKFLYSKCIY